MTAAPAGDALVLETEGLYVRYGRRTALDGLSFGLERGTVYALLGRNGAGKSSLVRCLLGQQRPRAGRCRLFGEDVWRRRRRLMARVGVLPEEPDAPPAMTASALVAFSKRLYPQADTAAMRARLSRSRVPLDVPFGRLSKGEKGAVMLALALGHRPELLVLDEPTLGLDAVARRTLYDELIGDLADRGTTILLTTHDLAGVEERRPGPARGCSRGSAFRGGEGGGRQARCRDRAARSRPRAACSGKIRLGRSCERRFRPRAAVDARHSSGGGGS